jgi:hypothetical protein
MLLISGGVLGGFRLRRSVAIPELGNTAMLANFFLFALILRSPSNRRGWKSAKLFAKPMRYPREPGSLRADPGGRAAYFQVIHDQDLLARDVRISKPTALRAQHKPASRRWRGKSARQHYDRNGVLPWLPAMERARALSAEYETLVWRSINLLPPRSRHYPGELTAHFSGRLAHRRKFSCHQFIASLNDSKREAARLPGLSGTLPSLPPPAGEWRSNGFAARSDGASLDDPSAPRPRS